ncbi:AAA family ATPase [Pseudochrobactrum saccharolyticum]|uniref:AAA family ATPase n=1 Tax=Pseudochrobactrum saccharolyticum TaxID=354352 RepID=UPI00276763F0|nr:DUF3696 domain-containing protein [Pseudochrobactrum saccharolyticum]MDP8252568.1 DUF3696 domain-containing protein [Pseudochrobactrum saccharolyticum]
MISEVKIKNFKSFIDAKIPLSKLTLLTGLNSSGKSSIIQALRMYDLAHSGKSPLLMGHGGIAELRSKFVAPKENISISLTTHNNVEATLTLNEYNTTPPTYAPELIYVGADRLGPQPNLPIDQSLNSNPRVGEKGEYVLDFISRLVDQNYILPSAFKHETSQSLTFDHILQNWLSEITPGVKFNFSHNKKADVSHAEIDSCRPTNVGFGLSYTLPIIAAALGSVAQPNNKTNNEHWVDTWEKYKKNNGVLLIIENPEAHLHPKGQTAMGKLLALCAQQGSQVIIETHSEHVMDGIRIAIKQQALPNTAVKFHYFSKNTFGESQVKSPNIDENAKIDSWPEGFFDQTLINRAILAKRN